jgi:hypothetical protein
MERDEIKLRERINRLLEAYSFEEFLDINELSQEDVLVILIRDYGYTFPDMEPC